MDAFLLIYGLALMVVYIGAFALVVQTLMGFLYVFFWWGPREIYLWHHQRGEIYRWYRKRATEGARVKTAAEARLQNGPERW